MASSFIRWTLAASITAVPLFAQEVETFRRFTVAAGAGFITPAGDQSGKLDRGLHSEFQGGYFFHSNVGVTGNVLFSAMDINATELSRLGQTSGSTNIIAVTLDPTFRFKVGKKLSVYVFGGGGYLRRRTDLTHPSVAQTVNIGGTTVTLDPGFGFFGPSQVTGAPITTRATEGSGAFDFGAGLNIPISRTPVKFFLEGRYVNGFTGTSKTTIIPFTIGIRW